MEQIPTILCIDDFKAGLITRKAFLESFGFQVLIADSGIEGLAILNSRTVNAVVLDYRMPLLDGEVVAERIRRFRPDIPILLLSGTARLPKALKDQVDRSLLKGNDPRLLIWELDSLTASTTAERKRTMKDVQRSRVTAPMREIA